MRKEKLPELLAPCGDFEALQAAIAGGANAVYLGLDIFNARIRAKNFTLESLEQAVVLAHAHGVRVFVTLNTQIYDVELEKMLEYVSAIYLSGADALIVVDLGVASLIKESFPDFEIHASTQCTAHNLDGVKALNEHFGFSRVVLARELDKENIAYVSKNAPIETEIFVHGAHCMSVSGQCLMSYAMGGRSGNRGECAQPCRLPYKIGSSSGYPLSLKDMTLSSHIGEIIDSGAASLKIEGRMKNASYVFGTVSIWRRLLDQGRGANKNERSALESLFSRQGFTDGYFTSNITKGMLGIRSEQDKQDTKNVKQEITELKKAPISLSVRLYKGEKAELTITDGKKTVTAYGDIVEEAINAPLSDADIKKSLSKFGQTPYEVSNIKIEKSDSIMLRVSSLNALRRSAYELLVSSGREARAVSYTHKKRKFNLPKRRTALFYDVGQIPKNKDYFDIIYLPLEKFKPKSGANGILMPPVIFDSEWKDILPLLKEAREGGVKYALCSNIGQIEVLEKHGFEITADFRCNVFNAPCVDKLLEIGCESVILSPELTLPQINDLQGAGVIAYGKIPVMLSHKCPLKDSVGCDKCNGYLQDRQGAKFYMQGVFGHRCQMHNSVPIYMADKQSALSSHSLHFIFSDESQGVCYDIIEAYKSGKASNGQIKRIK